MPLRTRITVFLTLITTCLVGCGSDSPPFGGSEEQGAKTLGFPYTATKNTTRVASSDPVEAAAAVSQVIAPQSSLGFRPQAVVLVDANDWRTAISAAQLFAPPLRLPLLFYRDQSLPEATKQALGSLQPSGSQPLDRAQVLALGSSAPKTDFRSKVLSASDYAAQAHAIDRLSISTTKRRSESVLIAPADNPRFAIAAAGWAAKSGDPVLWVTKTSIPKATAAALRDHIGPRIYLLGPENVISPAVAKSLRRFGRVNRVAGPDAITTSINFARYVDGNFGWGVTDPGHGLVIVNANQAQNAAAAAALSGIGTYGPALAVENGRDVPKPLLDYLLDIKPGHDGNPTRGVYNHGWIIGDEKAVTVNSQAKIDSLLEISPVERVGR